MDVAIMGAGLSGLACALYLEDHGIYPTIFDSRSRAGDRFICGELLLNAMSKPINNSLDFLRDEYKINLKSLGKVEDLIVHSRNEESKLSGNLGDMNLRGRHKDAFENQLYEQVKSEVVFNSKRSYEDLKNEFSHLVLATGDAQYAIDLSNYRNDFTVSLKGCVARGNFEPNTNHAWLNYDFAPKGYGYLIPFSSEEANIVLAFPDHEENREKDIEDLWNMYFDQVSKDLKQSFNLVDGFQIRKYIIGICDKAKIDNTYFVGNCFGAILPFLGFGQFNALLTGIYAARDILGMDDYEDLTRPLKNEYENSLKLRKAIESLDNSALDLIVKSLRISPINKLANYSLGGNSSANILKFISKFIK